MKLSNFDPNWGALLGGGAGVVADALVDSNSSLVLHLTNKSGATRSAGDVVIIDTATNESFTVSVTSNVTVPLGVVDEAIAIDSNGRVVVGGYAAAVSTLGLSARGDYLYHASNGRAAHMFGTSPSAGAFGYVLAGGSNASTLAHIFPTYSSSTLSAASNTTDVGGSVVLGATGKYSDGAHVHRGVSAIAHSSNTLYGTVTLTTPGNTVGITMPSVGTLALTSVGGSGGSGTATGQGLVDFARSTRTSGNVTCNSTTWANVDTATDLTLTASTGQWLEIGLSSFWTNNAVTGNLTVVTLVGGSPVNDTSTGAAPDNTTAGVGAWRGGTGDFAPIGGSILYQLVSGDLSGDTVTLRLRYRTQTAANKTLGADSATVSLHFWAKNLGGSL